MRWVLSVLGLGLAAATVIAVAEGSADDAPTSPVVVELYTSQGCSSCPPADALFSKIARLPGVIGLALHVDYWDYLGWEDPFGSPAHTDRQRAYAKAHKERTIYTPQIIVDGEDLLIGHDEQALLAHVAEHSQEPVVVAIGLTLAERTLRISLAPRGEPVGPVEVQVVQYVPNRPMTVEAGENAGYHHDFTNVVTEWDAVGRWDGASAVELDHPLGPDGAEGARLVVIVQEPRHGSIVGAATLP
jgi:hypothetical protein